VTGRRERKKHNKNPVADRGERGREREREIP
jgi:hypothetical protein